MKKLLWIAVVLLALALCAAASADVITSADGWQYEVRNGSGTLKGYTGEETKLILPASIDGIPMTAVGANAFEGNVAIREVVIPDGYTSIGAYAFRNCTRIASLRISGTVREWPESWGSNSAFAGCINLFEVEFGEGLASVGSCAFEGCTLLDSVTLPSSVTYVGKNAFRDCELLDTADVYGSVGANAFLNCSYMSSLTLRNAEKIEDCAFQNCTSLQKAELPETLTHIGADAFRGCSKLKAVAIPDSVEFVGAHAFYDCKQLKELTVGAGVRTWGSSWGEYAPFAQNPSLASVTIRPGVQVLPQSAFTNCDSLVSVELPDGLLTIGDSAFQNCDQLSEVVFPDSLTEIGHKAFLECRVLAGYTMPAGLELIGNSAFMYTAAEEVIIPDKVTKIGCDAFRECPNLKRVVLGECVSEWTTSWGSNAAFASCPLLAELEVRSGVNSIGPNAFMDCVSLVEVELPASSISVGASAFRNCESLKRAVVYRGTICEKAFENCTALESVSLRKVTEIEREAFLNCRNLAEAELPRTLLVLGNCCFKGTALQSVVIPDSTTDIGAYAFQDCSRLQSVYIGNNISTWVTNWGSNSAFCNCSALEYVYFEDDGTTVGNTCFEGCVSLKAVYIPRSVLNIPDSILVNAATGTVIYGQAGSAAEAFAASKGLPFETGAFPFSFDQ